MAVNPFSLLNIANDPSLTQRTVNAAKSASAYDQAAMERMLANKATMSRGTAKDSAAWQRKLLELGLPSGAGFPTARAARESDISLDRQLINTARAADQGLRPTFKPGIDTIQSFAAEGPKRTAVPGQTSGQLTARAGVSTEDTTTEKQIVGTGDPTAAYPLMEQKRKKAIKTSPAPVGPFNMPPARGGQPRPQAQTQQDLPPIIMKGDVTYYRIPGTEYYRTTKPKPKKKNAPTK